MKKALLCAVFVLVSGLAVVSAKMTAADDLFSYIPYASASWSSATSNGDEPASVHQNIMYKGKKLRAETLREGETGIKAVMIMTSSVMYLIDNDKKSGIKTSVTSAMNPNKMQQEAVKMRNSAKHTGSGTVNGVNCAIYSYTYTPDKSNPADSMTVTEWRQKDGLALKTVTEFKATKFTTVISNIKKNPALSDSLFVPPGDVKIVDMEKMGGFSGMTGMPGQAPKDEPKNSGKEEEAAPPVPEDTPVDAGKVVQDKAGEAAKDALKNLFGR